MQVLPQLHLLVFESKFYLIGEGHKEFLADKTKDLAILSAAVADFKPETVADKKIKREKDDLVLRLNPTHDIARELGKRKRSGQLLVGFALETNDEETNAEKKLEKKNFDFIVLNSLQVKDTCFGTDNNQITIISKKGKKAFGKKPLAVRRGGSIPIISTFEQVLGIKTVLMGFGLESNAIHSPNENFPLDMLRKGIVAVVGFHRALEMGK